VRQEAECYELPFAGRAGPVGYPLLGELCAELADRLHAHGLPGWVPNEVAVQRYRPEDVGITPHRDQRRFALLVAVVTVAGSAPFTLHCERAGPPTAGWRADAGSLVLLRGPGLAGDTDGRPMHAVGSPIGAPRTSIGVRMDTA
jgi:alkylated DNA repair dioxygenase AlkB